MSAEEYRRQLSGVGKRHGEQEHNLQVACVRWFGMQFPQLAPLLFAIPNGGYRDVRVAAKLRAEGVRAGVPDMMLAVPKGQFCGLFVEMKNGKAGRLSDHQRDMIARLQTQGYRVEVCRTFEEFVSATSEYLGFKGFSL